MVMRNVSLRDDEHIRIIYTQPWTPPTIVASGDYPNHLNDAIIIGSVGQALIYKAERYTQSSVDTLDRIVENLTELDDLWPDIPTVTPPTPPDLPELTPPDGYTVVKPTSPTLSSAPSAPTAPTLTFTDFDAALAGVADEITAAKAYLTTGLDYINAATRGEGVSYNYNQYAQTVMSAAGHKLQESLAQLQKLDTTLNRYSAEVASYGSEVNGYANQISAIIGKYREEINAEMLGVNNAGTDANVFLAQIRGQESRVNIYQAEVAGFQAEISNIQNLVNIFTARAQAILTRAAHEYNLAQGYLDAAGRFLASGQSKINEMIIMLGQKPELYTQKSSSEQRS